MAHIKEPKGVDFIIQSEPLTDDARREITAFIQAYKSEKPGRTKRVRPTRTNAQTPARA